MPYLKVVSDLHTFCNWKYIFIINGLRNNHHNLYFEWPDIYITSHTEYDKTCQQFILNFISNFLASLHLNDNTYRK